MKRILPALAVLAFFAAPLQAAPHHPPKAPPHVSRPLHQPPPPHVHHHAPLHGNVMSKTYHARDCEFYDGKGRIVAFPGPREAERAGFRPCKICEGKEGVATAKRQHRQDRMRHRYLRGDPGSKALHGPSCRSYNDKRSSVRFRSIAEARRHGYHLCPFCGGK